MINLKYKVLNCDQVPMEFYQISQTFRDKGGEIYKVMDGKTYIYISLGSRNTGGYGVEITGLNVSSGEVTISYKEISPMPRSMVIQAITYPDIYLQLEGEYVINFQKS